MRLVGDGGVARSNTERGSLRQQQRHAASELGRRCGTRTRVVKTSWAVGVASDMETTLSGRQLQRGRRAWPGGMASTHATDRAAPRGQSTRGMWQVSH
jgi:hypothetical protein